VKLRRFIVILVLLATSGWASDRDWVEVRSPHFQVISDAGEGQARKVALGFEQIHAIFGQAFPQLRADPGETIVIAPRDEATMRILVPGFWERKGIRPAGLFRPGWEKNYAIVRADLLEGSSVVYHEYMHKLLHLNYPRLPTWLDEGLAEFYGTSEVRGDKMLLGAPSRRMQILHERTPFPLKEFLTPANEVTYFREEWKVQMFYAEAWGLTHFLMFGNGMGNGERMNTFLRQLGRGADEQDAFRQAFGAPATIEKEFSHYMSLFVFKAFVYQMPKQIDQSSFAGRKLSNAEANTELGGFYTYFSQHETARKKLDAALAEDPKSWLAHENMAFVDFVEGRDADAAKEFDLALELKPDSYLSQYYRAMLAYAGKRDTDSAARLDHDLGMLLTLNPKFAPAYVVRSRLYARENKLSEALQAAVQAEKLEPGRAGYHLNVAEMELLRQNPRSAVEVAKYVAKRWDRSDRAEALDFLEEVRAKAHVTATPEEVAEESALRKYADGTIAALGTLEAINCEKSKPVEIIVRSGDKTLKFNKPENVGVGLSDTLWYGSDHFSLCHHLEGMAVVARYKTDAHDPTQNELKWLEVREQPAVPWAEK
jgi:tetratricopeptide (TPR) repeat protein